MSSRRRFKPVFMENLIWILTRVRKPLIISIKRNHQSGVYFQIAISLIAYVATFSGQFYFWRSYFFTLFQSDYFGTTVTSSEQLFFQSSCFFLLFQNSHFFAAVIFSEQLLFQNENSTEQPVLENEKFFVAVTFRNSCFSLFRIKTPKKELLFQGRYFYTVSTFPEKLHFGKS